MADISKTIYFLNREQEERHTKEIAQKIGIPYIDLTGYPISPDVLNLIPKELCLQYQVIPYLRIGSSVKIGITNPNDAMVLKFLDTLSKETHLTFSHVLISKSALFYGILSYEKKEKEVQEKKDEQKKTQEESFDSQISDITSAAKIAKNVTTTKLLDVIMAGAMKTKSSDVHVEPGESEFLVRYRIDGVLQDVVRLPINQYKTLLSRIKFLAKLKMDNAIEPQDGRFSMKTPEGEELDLRISTMPSAGGESIVIRLLGQEKALLSLETLGFRSDALAVLQNAIRKPHGMILTSGPTGSGKSSTLYAILSGLNKPSVKIITLEDPVEYHIDGIEQSQIEKEEGYTFAEGLRASLRQDPDIIMVGEIRDQETAEIAVQAAMTGHLMLSTIHANSAPGVFVRLLDIGVKPFLLSGSINVVMAQRLVRKICSSCVSEYTPKPEVWQEMVRMLTPIKDMMAPETQAVLSNPNPVLKSGKGCTKCNHSGFSGREVIIEVLVPNEAIDALVARQVGLAEFQKVAIESKMITMEQDGLIKVLQGSTTVEEVWRVTKD